MHKPFLRVSMFTDRQSKHFTDTDEDVLIFCFYYMHFSEKVNSNLRFTELFCVLQKYSKKQGCRNSPAKKFFLFLITSEASNKVLKCKAFQVLT